MQLEGAAMGRGKVVRGTTGAIVVALLMLGVGCSSASKPEAVPSSSAPSSSEIASPTPRASWYPDAVLTSKPSPATHKPLTINATDSLTFTPDIAYVKAGTKVTWEVALGTVPHTVTFVNGPAFEADLNSATPTASRLFSTPGTYRYVCTLHNNMAGEVVVKA